MGCISDLTGYNTSKLCACVRTSVLVMYAIAMGRSSVPRSIATTVACEGVQGDPPALLPVGIMLVAKLLLLPYTGVAMLLAVYASVRVSMLDGPCASRVPHACGS